MVSCHSGAIFEHFGRWNIRCYLGGVLGGFGKGFSEGFGHCKLDFGASKKGPISKPKLEPEKMVPGTPTGASTGGSGSLHIDR